MPWWFHAPILPCLYSAYSSSDEVGGSTSEEYLSSLPDPDFAYTRQKLISPLSTNNSLRVEPSNSPGFHTTTFSQLLPSKTGTISSGPSDSLQFQASMNLGVGIRAGSHHFFNTAIRRGSRYSPGMMAVNMAQIYKRFADA